MASSDKFWRLIKSTKNHFLVLQDILLYANCLPGDTAVLWWNDRHVGKNYKKIKIVGIMATAKSGTPGISFSKEHWMFSSLRLWHLRRRNIVVGRAVVKSSSSIPGSYSGSSLSASWDLTRDPASRRRVMGKNTKHPLGAMDFNMLSICRLRR